MTIDNLYIPYELNAILLELRSQLNANGIQLLSRMIDSGEDIMVQCPYHKNGQERRPSAGIRKSDGMFHCLACDETHSLPEVISYCFGHRNDMLFGHKWLAKNFVSIQANEREDFELDLVRDMARQIEQATKYVSEEELDTYRYTHPYMYKRGLTNDVIELFDIGYDRQRDCITFPVRELNGKCLFVARRNVAYKRFDIPKGTDKPLYGYYEVAKRARELGTYIDKIYVCEGLFDCLRLWCNGKCAVAGFGCLYNSLQMFELSQLPTRNLVLALDSDIAGQLATDKLKEQITDKIITTVILPRGRKDIGECTDEEIQNLQEEF